MATATIPPPTFRTLADLLADLGVPPDRVRVRPPPGMATKQDVLRIYANEKVRCELVHGVLVEKAMGLRESLLAVALGAFLFDFVRPRNLGLVTRADGMMRLAAGLIRIPDVSFISWDRIPGRRLPSAPIPDLAPDLAAEVLSKSNTDREMQRKLDEYFTAGVRLVWLIDPVARTVEVFTSVEQSILLREDQTLDGGTVLPGFTLPLRELFAELDRQGV